MSALRTLIASSLNLPEKNIFNKGQQIDVSQYPYYLTVKKNASVVIGRSNKYFDNEDEIQTISRETEVEITFYGKNAMQWIEKLEAALCMSYFAQAMKKHGFAYLRATSPLEMTGPLAGGYESRAMINITFSHSQIIQTHTNPIESVEIENIKE